MGKMSLKLFEEKDWKQKVFKLYVSSDLCNVENGKKKSFLIKYFKKNTSRFPAPVSLQFLHNFIILVALQPMQRLEWVKENERG